MLKVKLIQQTKPSHMKCIKQTRCTYKVSHSGNGLTRHRPTRTCTRFSTVEIEGEDFCTQHAGQLALLYILGKKGEA